MGGRTGRWNEAQLLRVRCTTGGNLAGPPIQLTTVKYQACTRTQNRIVLGTSREHMLEFA